MKKLICIFFCLLILTAPAFAVQYLQVDVSDTHGVYNPKSGMISPMSDDFTFYALVDLNEWINNKNKAPESIASISEDSFHISIELMSPLLSGEPSDGFDYGSFEFGGETYEVTSSNLNDSDNVIPGNLKYGVLPTNEATEPEASLYFDVVFSFGDVVAIADASDSDGSISYGTAGEYTSMVDWGGPDSTPESVYDATGVEVQLLLAYAGFFIDMSNLNSDFDLRFDLYTLNEEGDLVAKASETHYVQTAPEPGTMMLFGFGLIWMARMGRKKLL